MNYAAFIKGLSGGGLRPAYLFAGKEGFLAESGVKALVDKLLTPEEQQLNLATCYGRDAAGLTEALTTPPFMASRRVTIVKQAQDLTDRNLDAVVAYLQSPPADGCLILWAGQMDKRRSFFKRVDGLVDMVDCAAPKGRQLVQWMVDYVARWDKRLDDEAIGRLSTINWPGLRELAGELDRLTLLVGGEPDIRAGDIEELGGGSFAFEMWRLTDAVGAGNLAAALGATGNLQRWSAKPRDVPMKIVSSLFYLFRRLWLIKWSLEHKQLQQAKEAVGLQPFVFNRYLDSTRGSTLDAITEGIFRIMEADMNIKRGLRPPDLEVNLLVTELTKLWGHHT